ncbi:MAG: DUF2269 domain-containing protein [Actinobacteria bacterium]|nr:DUF2269 domain-containing protein [Actinomycetota bacterium]
MYEILKFLHVVLMFTAASIFVGGEFYTLLVEGTRDPVAIRRVYQAGKRLDRLAIPAMLLGGVFGLITAINGNLDLTQTWLILGYAGFLSLVGVGIGYWTPRAKRILQAAEASPDREASPELTALLGRQGDKVPMVIDLAIWVGIIFVMVTKPFS